MPCCLQTVPATLVTSMAGLLLFLLLFILLLASPMTCDAKPRNLALGKPTQQSGTFSTISGSMNAVDGDTNPDFNNGSCTHSDETLPSWWMVDLGGQYLVSAVEVANRNKVWERLANFSVEVYAEDPRTLSGFPGNTAEDSKVCARQETPLGPAIVKLILCQKPVRGRYVRVVKFNENVLQRPLSLCEFRVFDLREFTLEPASSFSKASKPIKTIPRLRSRLECVHACTTHPGPVMCRLVQFHAPTGECQMFGSYTASDVALGEGWNVFKVKED